MTSTDSIDIKTLQDFDILYHTLHTNNIAAIRIQLMAVNTLYQNRLTVDQQLLVLDFHFTEAHFLSDGFYLFRLFFSLALSFDNLLNRNYLCYKSI